jgi:hypothetical protein
VDGAEGVASMDRYFVVLNGTRSGVPYVVAEVVREPGDDGRDREMSLAGNLAGTQAIIATEGELRGLPGGRVAIERWRSGNDNSFVLDTLAHDLDPTQMPGRTEPIRPALSVGEAHLLVERSRHRSREALKEAAVVRETNRSVRESLRETLERVEAQRFKTAALLEAIGMQTHKQARHEKRRHLRSVS